MAPAPETTYFPPLDKCLAGTERLISWKTAYRALCDVEHAKDNTTLQHFLNDDETIRLLSRPCGPYTRPTTGQGSTRSKFESKTAPIQVSQSSNGDYDLEEIKRDALWLSEQLNVDELVALRIAILEWQQRAADQLLAGTTESDTAAAKPAESRASFLASTASFGASLNGPPNAILDFSREDVRRNRILRIHTEERGSLLKLSADLVSYYASQASAGLRTSRIWIDELAVKVADKQCSPLDSKASQEYLAECINVIDKTLQKLHDPAQWPKVFLESPVREDLFATTTLLNIGDEMRLVLAQLYTIEGVPGGFPVLRWFNIMKREHFQHLQELPGTPTLRDVSSIQCLASAISLALLQPGKTMQLIREAASAARQPEGAAYPQLRDEPYIADDRCVEELNTLILLAAAEGYDYAIPAVYAWGIIIMCIRDIAVPLITERQRESEVAVDEGSSDTEAADRGPPRREARLQETPLEKQWELIQRVPSALPREARTDPAKFLLAYVVGQMNVYGVIPGISSILSAAYGGDAIDQTALLAREALLALIKDGFEVVPYSGEVLEALFTVLAPSLDPSNRDLDLLPNSFVLDYNGGQPYVVEQALQRYPYELSPLLRIMTIVANADSEHRAGPPDSVQLLEALQTVTLMVPYDFRAFRLENEEANTNEMVLTDTLSLFVPKQASFAGEQRLIMDRAMHGSEDPDGNILLLPAGTTGYVIREDRPIVLKLVHKHSALEYLGLLLSTLLPTSPLVSAEYTAEMDRQTASEIVVLMNALLSAALRQHQGAEEAKFILGRLSNALPNEQDIITIVADIFEMQLLAHLDQAAQDGSLDLLVAGAELLSTLVKVSPERVWSILSRGSLLGTHGGASALAAVVGGTEVQLGQFRFLAACTRLYSRMVDDAIAGLVRRKPRASVASRNSRFDSPMQSADLTPERTMRDVLTAYQRVMLDGYQNLAGWRFSGMDEKQEIAETMARSFDVLLRSTYGLEAPVVKLAVKESEDGTAKKSRERMASLLMPAAGMVVQAFAPEAGIGSLLDSVAGILGDGTAVGDDLLPTSHRLLLTRQVNATSAFLAGLLRTLRTTEAQRARNLATGLLKTMPALATLFATDHAYRHELSILLHELVDTLASDETSDPPSLLGPLGPEAAKSFLALVSQLDRPLCDVSSELSMWTFLTAVLKGRQQWFAIYLLTGTLPKSRLKDSSTGGNGAHKKSSLTHALDELADISAMNPRRAAAMLHFVAVAQKVWVWATVTVRSHPVFLKNALAWLDVLQAPPRSANIAEALISANEHQTAAYLCNILAVNLHAGLETGDKTVLKMVVPKLGFLAEHGVTVNAYNRSLHRRLAENLARKFPQCDLADFQRSGANAAPYGKTFRYDTELAGIVLGGHEQLAWYGDEELRIEAYKAEVERANVNLSLVDAQRTLLDAWKTLATTLAEFVDAEPALQPALVQATQACLRANVDARLDEPGTAEVLQTRAEMAFVLLSKLVGVKAKEAVMKELLPAAWNLVRTSPVDYDVATAPEDLLYYRTLLQILYLAIRPHCYMPLLASPPAARDGRATETEQEPKPTLPVAVAGCLVEIVDKTIVPGFRALCANLHTDLQLALPSDFALINALLQAVLSVKGIHIAHIQIAEAISRSAIVRSALSLYSWSDQLAEAMIGQDPIYGEVAITFLLTLSSLRPLAEQMALDGVLTQLSSANLSNYFRKPGGKGPFDEPARMFAGIWSEGFLPLCLNLLDAVGPPMAGEVAAFLNSFPEQLGRAEDAFKTEVPGYRRNNKPHVGDVSLGLVREVRSLVMIGLILRHDIARGAAEGVDAAAIPVLAYDLANAKDEVEKLARTQRSLADKVVATSEREAVWARTGAGGASDSLLLAMVVEEVKRTLRCFGE
ncbi:hypothetical protein LTR36_001526 [Oleoguttula mirabilis]|uniref:Nucleoporin NUP188 n=1 Tax=Oleoguttula mirabilis TaxID=1507867 RepID=A0AAV9JNS8_9PEZI|nr:hypothetical protein LTR36_001526 [Oleoguttula mirabilis]